MFRSGRTSLFGQMLDHLWEHRHHATISIAKATNYWGPRFEMTTSAGVCGTVQHNWNSLPLAHLSHDGNPVEGGTREMLMARQLMSSLQIMRMIAVLGDTRDLNPHYGVGALRAALGAGYDWTTPMRADALTRLDEAVAREVVTTGNIAYVRGISLDGRKSHVRLESEQLGLVVLPKRYGATRSAVEQVLAKGISDAISGAPRPLARLPQTDGSGRMTRVLQLCQEALSLEPDLQSLERMPIRPLMDEHVPELFARHKAALEHADAADVAAIDDELEVGIEVVTRTVRDALRRIADRRRQDLAEQISFLQARHPTDMLGSGGYASIEKEHCE